MRGGAQHDPGAVRARTTARSTRSGAPRTTPPSDIGAAQRRRLRQRRRPGLLLRRHHLRDHRDLRPVRAATTDLTQAPGGRCRPAARTTSPTPPPHPITVGGHKAYGVFVAPGTGYRNNQHQRHRHRRPARGHVRHLRRHPLQRRLLLRLRQRRDRQQRRRQRHHGGHLLRQHQGLGLRRRQRPLDHGRPGERPVLRRQRSTYNSGDPTDQLPLHHRHRQGRAPTTGPSAAATPSPAACPPSTTACGPTSPATTR